MPLLPIGLLWLALLMVSVEALRFSRERDQALARAEAAEREVARWQPRRPATVRPRFYTDVNDLIAHSGWGEVK